MGYEKPDPYYNPDHFGLVPVASVDWYAGLGMCYEFATTEVWKHTETGTFWWASDSGCSCNSPFEYFDMDDLAKGSWIQAIDALQSGLGESSTAEVQADVADAIQAILNAR